MTTANAAAALALGDRLGRIQVGYLADIAVFTGDASKPYDALLAASPKDVELVMVGGVVLYGDAQLVAAGPAQPPCEMLDVCGNSKFLCVATTDATNKLNRLTRHQGGAGEGVNGCRRADADRWLELRAASAACKSVPTKRLTYLRRPRDRQRPIVGVQSPQ